MYDIALFFGSFNPIHLGHISVGMYVLDHRIAAQVWYVVSPENPLKTASDLAPFSHRVAMARLATANEPRFQVSTLEQNLPKPSYTINSIKELKKRLPHQKIAILCGSDIQHQLHKWHKINELKALVDFIIYPRTITPLSVPTCSQELTNAPTIQAQATSIRQAITQNNDQILDTLLCESVKEYIISNNLYAYNEL